MKKILYILLILFCFTPLVVFAGGSDEDGIDVGIGHFNIDCVYDFKSNDPHYEENDQYARFQITGVGQSTNGESLKYSEGEITVKDGKATFKNNYDLGYINKRCLNYINDRNGMYFTYKAYINNQLTPESNGFKPISNEAAKKLADEGKLCPPKIMVFADSDEYPEELDYYFVFYENESQSSKAFDLGYHEFGYTYVKTWHFTGTSVNISNIGQDKIENTDAAEKVEQSEEKVEDICDEKSANYDAEKCVEEQIASGAVEETANDVYTYGFHIDVELDKLPLEPVTCKTLFMENGVYNSTHKILSLALKFMQYLGILVAFILSIIDFVQVIPSNNKDALMKSAKKAAMRFGIAIVIFFVPIVLDFILDLLGITDATCGLI